MGHRIPFLPPDNLSPQPWSPEVSKNGADEVKKVRPVRPMALRTIKKVVRTSTMVVQTGLGWTVDVQYIMIYIR